MMTRFPGIQLSKRNQRAVLVGVICLVLFAGFKWMVFPVFEKQKTLSRVLTQKKEALMGMEAQALEYAKISGNSLWARERSGAEQKNFSLFSFIDAQVRKSGIKENVIYMRPFTRKAPGCAQSMDVVDMKLSSVYFSDLMQFLSFIESGDSGVSIRSLSLTRTGNKKKDSRLDVLMETAVLVGEGKERTGS